MNFIEEEKYLIKEALAKYLANVQNNRMCIVESTIIPESEIESVKRIDKKIDMINNIINKI